MTRKVLCGLAVGGALFCVFAAAACAQEHRKHSYGEWEVTPAACEEAGVRVRKCTVCDEVEREEIPAIGHAWDEGAVTKDATCKQTGVRTRTCTVCYHTKTEVLPLLEHDWDEISVKTAATCTHAGVGIYTCLTCGDSSDEVELPMLAHVWQIRRSQLPTCEGAGLEVKSCVNCPRTETERIPALDHSWSAGETKIQPTCTEKGERTEYCTRCDKTRTAEIPALNHNWQGDFTIDVRPSFESTGEKSYHCTRCDERGEVTIIPKLDKNTPIEYEFRLMRNNGDRLNASSVKITVRAADGTVAAESTRSTLANGVFRTNLLPQTYTVELSDLPAGYSASLSYTVEAEDPTCTLWLTASPIPEAGSAQTRYTVGDVMHEFSFTAANSSTGLSVSLTEILKTKKMVLINFWYVDCPNCVEEFQALERVYQRYKDVAEVIAVNPIDSMASINTFARRYGLTFPMVTDTARLQSMFGVTRYPTSIVIDAEGVVCVTDGMIGATSEATFESYFAKYTSDSYWQNSAKTQSTEYALPVKRDE